MSVPGKSSVAARRMLWSVAAAASRQPWAEVEDGSLAEQALRRVVELEVHLLAVSALA